MPDKYFGKKTFLTLLVGVMMHTKPQWRVTGQCLFFKETLF